MVDIQSSNVITQLTMTEKQAQSIWDQWPDIPGSIWTQMMESWFNQGVLPDKEKILEKTIDLYMLSSAVTYELWLKRLIQLQTAVRWDKIKWETLLPNLYQLRPKGNEEILFNQKLVLLLKAMPDPSTLMVKSSGFDPVTKGLSYSFWSHLVFKGQEGLVKLAMEVWPESRWYPEKDTPSSDKITPIEIAATKENQELWRINKSQSNIPDRIKIKALRMAILHNKKLDESLWLDMLEWVGSEVLMHNTFQPYSSPELNNRTLLEFLVEDGRLKQPKAMSLIRVVVEKMPHLMYQKDEKGVTAMVNIINTIGDLPPRSRVVGFFENVLRIMVKNGATDQDFPKDWTLKLSTSTPNFTAELESSFLKKELPEDTAMKRTYKARL